MPLNWPDIPELWQLLDRYEARWKLSYPGLEITREVLRMGEWLEAHPKRKVRNWKRFMTGWLARNQAGLERVAMREQIHRLQERADAAVGKWEGYRT